MLENQSWRSWAVPQSPVKDEPRFTLSLGGEADKLVGAGRWMMSNALKPCAEDDE